MDDSPNCVPNHVPVTWSSFSQLGHKKKPHTADVRKNHQVLGSRVNPKILPNLYMKKVILLWNWTNRRDSYFVKVWDLLWLNNFSYFFYSQFLTSSNFASRICPRKPAHHSSPHSALGPRNCPGSRRPDGGPGTGGRDGGSLSTTSRHQNDRQDRSYDSHVDCETTIISMIIDENIL